MRQIIFSVSIFLLACTGLRAQVAKYSNEYLTLGAGARAMAMGNTAVLAADDATAGYWNPAGLNKIDAQYDASLMHAEYFAGMFNYDYAALAYRLDPENVLAFSVLRLGADDIQNTLYLIDENGNFNYDKITHFSVADYAFLMSYARQSPIKGLTVGGNLKIIYRTIGSFAKAYGFGFDVGLNYQHKNLLLAAVLRDATSTFNMWVFDTQELRDPFAASGNELPENSLELTVPSLTMAVGRHFVLSEAFALLAEANLRASFDGKRNVLIASDIISIDPTIGLELNYKDWLFVRAGVNKLQEISNFDKQAAYTAQPSMGLGLKYRKLRIDYALTDIGKQSGSLYSNIFSLGYQFDRPKH